MALLDDAAFRAYDLLALDAAIIADYKLLVNALRKRFSASTSQQELRWLFGQRLQGAEESIDVFADALIHLSNRAYPDVDQTLRMELSRDRFVAGIRDEHIQDALLRAPPETLDAARDHAKKSGECSGS